jgi:hypothetical protein
MPYWLFTTELNTTLPEATCLQTSWHFERNRMQTGLGVDRIAYVQIFDFLERFGQSAIVLDYCQIFKLTRIESNKIVTYMRYWAVLRRCCGPQMSDDFRARLLDQAHPMGLAPRQRHRLADPGHDSCEMYDITQVEGQLLQTDVVIKCGLPMLELGAYQPWANITGQFCLRYQRALVSQQLRRNMKPREPW